MARNFWPSSDPIGQRVSLGDDGRRLQVVGVAADTVHRVVKERPEAYVYLPFELSEYANRISIVLRTAVDSQLVLRTVSDHIRAMDPSLPIYELRTMQQRIDSRQQAGNLIIVRFFGICGGLALFLSIVGLTGTVSYSVGQRVREFGIRAAIGASPADQAKLVLTGALGMAGPGIVMGLFGALLLSWLIAGRVSGLDLRSPMMYALVGLLQLMLAIAAAAIPGRRAARANPLAALRSE
jgi:ABC-type antimicrobial peptide transport system permease subunit